MEIGEVVTLAALAALVTKFTTWLKFVRAKDWNATLTQAAVWAVGIGVAMIAAQADVAQGLTVFGNNLLADLDVWSQVLVGLGLGSAGSVVFYDYRKALDGSDSAKEPPLLGGG